ncbi:MAG: hypothetical protein QM784_21105 [Polyangiaceae bacterium]
MTRGESSPWGVRMSAVLLLLSVFTAGAFVGAGIYRFALLDRPEEPMPPVPPWRMFHELDLTADQQTKVKAVFEQYRPKIDAIVHEAFPKVHAIQDRDRRGRRQAPDAAAKREAEGDEEAPRSPSWRTHASPWAASRRYALWRARIRTSRLPACYRASRHRTDLHRTDLHRTDLHRILRG